MASIETLIAQITDTALRDKLSREVAEMKKRLDWGLVFERHLPENVRALSAPIKAGSVVWERRTTTPRRLRVRSTDGAELIVAAEPEKTTAPADAPTERIARSEVLVEQDFAEPVFPVPIPTDAVRNGPADRPYHAVICGENYHVLQSLLAAYERAFDLIYIDPPYNTGHRDWSYNNDYIDPTDTWRPSKWLAFMERRLRIAHRLLRPDGVLVVAIDENEHAHLVMLLQQIMPGYDITSVAIVQNPRGKRGDNFSFSNDFAVFVVPRGIERIAKRPLDETDESPLRNWGGESRRETSATCFYPIYVKDGEIVGFGDVADSDFHPGGINVARNDGIMEIWPLDPDGEAKWRYGRESVEAIRGQLIARRTGVGKVKRWDIFLLKTGGSYKTVWTGARYDASTWGSQVLSTFGIPFDYPKSIYTMRDVIHAATGDRPDAKILDFFAGSGTTLHGTLMLNADDGGRRRCLLVTNNEVTEKKAARLTKAGHFRGDPLFEAAGVFEAATRPRVIATVTGKRSNGTSVPGTYHDKKPFGSGFPENVEFFRLDYLDPAEIEFGLRFSDMHPLLWLRAGGIGEREKIDPSQPLGLPDHSPYAILFDPSGLPALLAALPERTDITHVFVVADSTDSFAQIVADLPREIEVVRLYRDYLEMLRGATR